MANHPFHVVDKSPWPITGAQGLFYMVVGLVSWMHRYETFVILWKIGFFLLLLTLSQWWRDIWREATYSGKHTQKVESGLRIGMLLFITSEICFFFSFFWAYFHASLSPNVETGVVWPPSGINALQPFEVPLLNTVLLLASGVTITWAHMAILNTLRTEANMALACTVSLGLLFSSLQCIEYMNSEFGICDSVYGGVFYIATGFHGLHVILGTLFIAAMWWRHYNGHFVKDHHFGFEASAWYWHFVDVVWLFLFICIYWWGY